MINSSTQFNEAVLEGGHPYLIQIKDGNTVVDCNVFSCSIYKGSTGNETFGVGTVFVPYVELEMDSLSVNLENKEISLQIGLEISGSVEWINMGYFTVIKAPTSTVRTKITAVGRISSILSTLVPTLTTPTTIASVLSDIEDEVVQLPNCQNFSIINKGIDTSGGAITSSLAGLTCKELLDIIAGITGAYITEDNEGNVVLFKYDTTTVIDYSGDAMITHPVVNNYDFQLSNIKVIVTEAYESEDGTTVPEVAYVSGTPIDWTIANSFMASQEMFETFCDNVLGLSYRPSVITLALGDPRLEASDVLRVTDLNESVYIVPCMSIVHTITGGIISMIITPGQSDSEGESTSAGPITKQIERMNTALLTAEDAIIKRARIDAANINSATIRDAWINQLMVQTGLLAQSGTIYTLDAIQVNASNITAGTIDVERLIVTVNGEKYLIHIDPNTSQPVYEKLSGNIIQPQTIAADRIVANSITTQQITTQNLVGTNGWINLANGTFFYGNGATWASCTTGIIWDGTDLKIKGNVTITGGNVYTQSEVNNMVSDSTYMVAIEVVSIDYQTPTCTLKARVFKEGVELSDLTGLTFNWTKNASQTSLGTSQTLTTTDLESIYICTIS